MKWKTSGGRLLSRGSIYHGQPSAFGPPCTKVYTYRLSENVENNRDDRKVDERQQCESTVGLRQVLLRLSDEARPRILRGYTEHVRPVESHIPQSKEGENSS